MILESHVSDIMFTRNVFFNKILSLKTNVGKSRVYNYCTTVYDHYLLYYNVDKI